MRYLRENWGLKLISLLLAILLWLIVVNVSKPEISDYRTVDLDILNQGVFAAEGKAWDVDRTTVSVGYTVRTDQRANISAKDFHAYIDLRDYSITGAVPVYVEVLNEKDSLISDVSARPSVVRVSIENVQEKQFDLKLKQVGTPADGFTVSNMIISPETVYVSGTESAIGRISEVGVNIDVNNLTESRSGTVKPVFYDANGNIITGLSDLSLSDSEINYSVTLHRKKSINLLSSIRGTPAAGYQYESMTVSPDSIQLSASNTVIDAMTVFELPAVDITGATGSLTQTFHIADYLPAGVELAEPSGDVNVTVRIERIPETETTAPESTESLPRESTRQENESGTEESHTETTESRAETSIARSRTEEPREPSQPEASARG